MSLQSHLGRRTPRPRNTSLKHHATSALAAGLAAAALAAPPALADDLRPPDARDAAAAQTRSEIITGGARAPDWLSPEARDTATAVGPGAAARTPDGPTVESNTAEGFDWTSAGVGAGAGIALLVIALAGAATVTRRFRPAPR